MGTQMHLINLVTVQVGKRVGVAGATGAAPNIEVLVYKVCGSNGCPTSCIAAAIKDAADEGVVAMNLSLGGGSLSNTMRDAIDYAYNKNALVIASAGNTGTSPVECPACYDRSLSVAATSWLGTQTYYSSYGDGLDMTAPGGQMYSNTSPESGIYSSVPDNSYAWYQGTSMSAPQVTGTAAVIASLTDLRGDALRARLLNTTDDIGSSGYDTTYGHGRLNVYRAIMQAEPPSVLSSTCTATTAPPQTTTPPQTTAAPPQTTTMTTTAPPQTTAAPPQTTTTTTTAPPQTTTVPPQTTTTMTTAPPQTTTTTTTAPPQTTTPTDCSAITKRKTCKGANGECKWNKRTKGCIPARRRLRRANLKN